MCWSMKSFDDYGEGHDEEKGYCCDNAVTADDGMVVRFFKKAIPHA